MSAGVYQIRPNICVVTQDAHFLFRVADDLKILESKEVGLRLLTRIGEGKHFVYISEGIKNHTSANYTLDSLGNIVGKNAPEAHVPLEEFIFRLE